MEMEKLFDLHGVECFLEAEKLRGAPQSRTEYDESLARREKLHELLKQLQQEVNRFDRKIGRLPNLPSLAFVEWANAIQTFENLAFLVLDTTGIKQDSDIIRVLLIDGKGETAYDAIMRPGRQFLANTAYTRITQDVLEASNTLAENWPYIAERLAGRYVLAYNFDWVQERLNENAKYYGLPRIHLVGDCLQKAAVEYFRSGSYGLKLVDACHRIGHHLPHPALAQDRAAGQLALLSAMAEGITEAKTSEDDDLGDLDAHPF